ncbi:MAG: SPFH domain-containing protein [Patescibacteria group bacterium]|nr:SPFH domain-containing protein [Patescibacteria group bacterium]
MRNAVESGVHSGGGITTMLSAGIAAGTTAFKAFNKVSMGEMGVRHKKDGTHYTKGRKKGQPYGIKGPGIYPVIPFMHSYKTIHVRNRTSNLPQLQFNCEERQVKLDSSIVWNVREEKDYPWRAMYRAENLHELTDNVTGICMNGLRKVTSNMTRQWLEDDQVLFAGLEAVCSEDLLYYGCALSKLNLSPASETIGEMIRQSGGSSASIIGAVAVSPEVQKEFIPRQGESPDLHIVN